MPPMKLTGETTNSIWEKFQEEMAKHRLEKNVCVSKTKWEVCYEQRKSTANV